MAVAIPIILAATGASAAIGAAIGVSAALVTVGVGVAVTASGIGAKVDKAFANVFGPELVQLGNIAGAAYLAFGSGFNGYDAMGNPVAEAGTAGNGLQLGTTSTAPAAAPTAAGATGTVDAAAGAAEAANTTGTTALTTGTETTAAGVAADTSGVAGPGLKIPQTTSAPNVGIAGATRAGTVQPGALAGATKWFNSLNPNMQAAVLQLAGNTLAGGAQGFMGAKSEQDQRDWIESQNRIYRSGSGVLARGLYTARGARSGSGSKG